MFYPIFINSNFIKCLVVGGGHIAARKVKGLVDSEVLPVIIAPDISDELQEMITCNTLTWHQREFESGDTIGFTMVFAATSNASVNKQVKDETIANHLLFDDVSDATQSNFIVPAVVKRGALQLAVTTSGYSPYLCRRLQQFFESLLPEDAERRLTDIKVIREKILERANGDEPLKMHLMETEVEPQVLDFLKKMTR